MSELPLYQIVDWNEHFENNKSRTRDNCQFVCVPNKHGGAGLANVQGQPNGAAIYGIWCFILELCSRQRRPRLGYLTADGKPDGRRLGAEELARLFRRPIGEITTCLRVVSSSEVAWMKLLDGQAETTHGHLPDTEGILHRHLTDTYRTPSGHLPDTKRTPDGHPESHSADTQGTLEGHSGVLNEDTERKKERMKEPPSIPQGGTEMSCIKSGQSEQETERQAGSTAGPTGETPMLQPVSDDMNVADAKAWVNSLFRRQRAWSYEEQSELSRLLPISKEDRALLSWAYTLPRDSEGWALIRGNRASKPKQSILLLVREFSSEVDKWNSARQSFGVNGQKKPVEREEDLNLTPEQVVAAKKIYGDDAPLPKKWGQLAPQVRREITEAMAT